MPERFVFRQVDYRDIVTFLNDGEIRAPNHITPQRCYQTSYSGLVNRRGTGVFNMPNGGVVNDYVAFYFSPFTGFANTIHKGNVKVINPQENFVGMSQLNNRVFIVSRISSLHKAGVDYCFSNLALNSEAPLPTVVNNPASMEAHINWEVFDDLPRTAHIPEIGYGGVCKYFFDGTPTKYQNRSKQRMAEFLVHNSLSLDQVSCIVTPNDAKKSFIQKQMDGSAWDIPIYAKSRCFVR